MGLNAHVICVICFIYILLTLFSAKKKDSQIQFQPFNMHTAKCFNTFHIIFFLIKIFIKIYFSWIYLIFIQFFGVQNRKIKDVRLSINNNYFKNVIVLKLRMIFFKKKMIEPIMHIDNVIKTSGWRQSWEKPSILGCPNIAYLQEVLSVVIQNC